MLLNGRVVEQDLGAPVRGDALQEDAGGDGVRDDDQPVLRPEQRHVDPGAVPVVQVDALGEQAPQRRVEQEHEQQGGAVRAPVRRRVLERQVRLVGERGQDEDGARRVAEHGGDGPVGDRVRRQRRVEEGQLAEQGEPGGRREHQRQVRGRQDVHQRDGAQQVRRRRAVRQQQVVVHRVGGSERVLVAGQAGLDDGQADDQVAQAHQRDVGDELRPVRRDALQHQPFERALPSPTRARSGARAAPSPPRRQRHRHDRRVQRRRRAANVVIVAARQQRLPHDVRARRRIVARRDGLGERVHQSAYVPAGAQFPVRRPPTPCPGGGQPAPCVLCGTRSTAALSGHGDTFPSAGDSPSLG